MAHSETLNYSLSSSDDSFAPDSDDSQEDPPFDFLEDTRSSFSRLSVKKKSESRIAKEKDEDKEGEPYVIEMAVPDLNEKDQKSYESIQKGIEAGQVQKLKVDQCKIYLRKHGLRLTGTKDILIQRIKEHLEILNGGGEKKYPPSSFIVNCKGDACTGDVVLFEQNIYEMFSIASRCANGPPCGTRVIAGRIVKESYGAAKQQHTFTVSNNPMNLDLESMQKIEVLWSKGEKPLPPLHPLLIKGRNLYRLKTMRQKWEDEGERHKILTEKHGRGCVARSKRETRVQQREMRKMLKSNRNGEETRKQKINSLSFTSKGMANQPQQQTENMQDTNQAQCFIERPTASASAKMPLNRLHVQRPPLTSVKGNHLEISTQGHYLKPSHSTSSHRPGSNDEGPEKHNTPGNCVPERYAYKKSVNLNAVKSSFRGHKEGSVQKHFRYGSLNFNPFRSAKPSHAHAGLKNFKAAEYQVPGLRPEKSKVCRYHAQGRCYYGQNCKYLHQC